jgi:hypothetical protein
VGLLVGKLGQEVFVDAAEDVAGDALKLLGVEGAQQLAEHDVVQFLVLAFGQDAAQILIVGLDGLHGGDDGLGAVGAVRQGYQSVELGLGLQKMALFCEKSALVSGRVLPPRVGRPATIASLTPRTGCRRGAETPGP